jgi:16S rRNA (adenine1518-N6/adenine1519-N6)-dimethyltransferase
VPQRLGQHFLSSPHILERIAIACCGDHAGTVVEIGPGRGALTQFLLPLVDRLIAVEIDPELVKHLETRFAAEPKLTIVAGDALAQDFAAWRPDVVCGNLPYYAATPILTHAARAELRTVALVQREVADRITAPPGSRDYGFLTCEIALFADARRLFAVKAGSFSPPPKVESMVVSLHPHPRAQELQVEPPAFLRFLSACFRHKRKTLRNNLAGLYSLQKLDALPEASRRAEACSLAELAAFYRSLG